MMKHSLRVIDMIHYCLKEKEMVYDIKVEPIIICEINNTLQIVYI